MPGDATSGIVLRLPKEEVERRLSEVVGPDPWVSDVVGSISGEDSILGRIEDGHFVVARRRNYPNPFAPRLYGHMRTHAGGTELRWDCKPSEEGPALAILCGLTAIGLALLVATGNLDPGEPGTGIAAGILALTGGALFGLSRLARSERRALESLIADQFRGYQVR